VPRAISWSQRAVSLTFLGLLTPESLPQVRPPFFFFFFYPTLFFFCSPDVTMFFLIFLRIFVRNDTQTDLGVFFSLFFFQQSRWAGFHGCRIFLSPVCRGVCTNFPRSPGFFTHHFSYHIAIPSHPLQCVLTAEFMCASVFSFSPLPQSNPGFPYFFGQFLYFGAPRYDPRTIPFVGHSPFGAFYSPQIHTVPQQVIPFLVSCSP